MIKVEKFFAASAKDLEGLSYYEIISRLGLLSFNPQGNKPIELVAKLAQISESSTVLMVGCGSGGTAVHLAEATGATVHGIDILAESIRTANALASKSPARERLFFQIGDAHALPFPPGTFDVVVTEFMAFFLRQSAFDGFFSTLKPRGQVALAEIMKDPEVDAAADAKILEAERTYSDVLGYRLHIPFVDEYVGWLTRAGFVDVHVSERFREPGFREKVRSVGGWRNLFRIVKVVLKLMYASPALRKKFVQAGRVKRVMYQSRPTAKYVLQAVMTAHKP